MPLILGDVAPDFLAETQLGTFNFHEWMEGSWAILFSHPSDYTPVCTTELGAVANLMPEFTKRGVKLIALSCEDVECHKGWVTDIESYADLKNPFPFPIIADKSRELAVKFGMLDAVEKDKEGLPLAARTLFIFGPDKKLKLSILYPATTGRNFIEILRVVDSLQLTENNQVATPVNWQNGDACMVLPTVKEEELATLFPKGVTIIPVPSGRRYLRMTPQPE